MIGFEGSIVRCLAATALAQTKKHGWDLPGLTLSRVHRALQCHTTRQ